jgi:hypothetical protein
MPRKTTTQRTAKIARAKLGAPDVPPISCPNIDYVLDVLEEEFDSDCAVSTARLAMVSNCMEYIRTVNDTLRESSLYWYEQYKQEV